MSCFLVLKKGEKKQHCHKEGKKRERRVKQTQQAVLLSPASMSAAVRHKHMDNNSCNKRGKKTLASVQNVSTTCSPTGIILRFNSLPPHQVQVHGTSKIRKSQDHAATDTTACFTWNLGRPKGAKIYIYICFPSCRISDLQNIRRAPSHLPS